MNFVYGIAQLILSCLVAMILCAVCQSDGSNSPFHVPFDISLDGLHHIVGKKLGCFPGHVLL